VITFRVPTESATASTTELTVSFPESTPFLSVDTQPKAGWSATVTTARLAKPVKTADGQTSSYVSRVDWKADTPADAIPPGQFDMFSISAGPLPNAASVALPALQYYSDGTTVNWNEQPANDSVVPEHPAPVLQLAAATPSTADPVSAPVAQGADGFGIAGLAAGILALILALIALLRPRRSSTTAR
jgi:uncharacterized protein YcnI